MSPENQAIVRESFTQVVPIAPPADALLHDRLLVLDRLLKPLFKRDMVEQGRKLMPMLGTAVNDLHNPQTIVPAVQDPGRRHASYGLQPGHYDTIAEALLWTLGQGLGQAAWAKAYAILATVMNDAATP